MKKVKILSHPTQIATIQLDEYDYDENSTDDKLTKNQIRKWRRKFQQEMA